MSMDLEDQLWKLMLKGRMDDAYMALLQLRVECEAQGMTTEQIEKRFAAIIKRVMRTANGNGKTAAQ